MRWDELTGDAFSRAVADSGGVCLLPLGCLEHHAHHLPLATDMVVARELCERAARIEPAVVFPDFVYGQILEGRHMPGAFGIEVDLILLLLEATCREIARNGLTKILLVNGHGGNHHLLWTFVQSLLDRRRDFQVFLVEPQPSEAERTAIAAQWESRVDGHAGERETSLMLATRPDLVHTDRIGPDHEGHSQHRYSDLGAVGARTAIWFYADHPTHFCGEPGTATAQKGERVLDAESRAIARAIAAIRHDQVIGPAQQQFFDSAHL
jgi:creatinine amidohydrolase